MDDFSALAQRVAVSVGDLRGCLILSRDGMVLGAYPDGDEAALKPSWLRFAALGDVERSSVEFGDQIWVFVRRGPYASFAVAGKVVRPGVLIDSLEQALLAAEESRTKREALRLPEAAAAPSGRPRRSMHPPAARSPAPSKVASEPEATDDAPVAVGYPEEAPETKRRHERTKHGKSKLPGARGDGEDEAEVDKVLLAQEFSGLLQVQDDGDEGSF